MKLHSFFGLLMALSLFSACTDGDDPSSGEGRLNVLLTDAPFPYESVAEVNVTIFKVDARLTGAEMDEEDSDSMNSESETASGEMDPDTDPGDGSGSEFITLMETDKPVNLLELINGATEELAAVDIPSGTYDLVRVYVKGISVVLVDGKTFSLKVPSGSQTGIKVFIKPGLQVAGGLSSDLLLDFDLSRSFVAKGGPGIEGITGFNFKPVIKASNLSTTGTLTGRITALDEAGVIKGLEGAEISVLKNGEPVTSTFSDPDGAYTIMGLEAGEYGLEITLEGYETSTAGPISIVAANRTTQDVELTAEP